MLVQFTKLLKRPKNSIYAGTHEIPQNTTKNNIKRSNSLIKEQYIWWYKTQNYSKFPGTVYMPNRTYLTPQVGAYRGTDDFVTKSVIF